jgi:hypothetical protein
MLAETIVVAVTVVTVSSLALANALDKRLNESEPLVKIHPYVYPSVSEPCPLCGVMERGSGHPNEWGRRVPTACEQGPECPGYPKSHLHQSCGYCKGAWLMATKS